MIMTNQQQAARLREIADAFDPPPAPIKLPGGDMTLDEAARIVKGLHSGSGAPNIYLKIWLHYNPPQVEWEAGASQGRSSSLPTLRAAVESLQAKLAPKVEGTVTEAQEVLDAATERQLHHDAIGEEPEITADAAMPYKVVV